MPADSNATYLVTHVIGSEQTEVGLGSMFRVTTLKFVELSTVREGIVAILGRKSKDIDIIRSTGTLCGVWNKEPRTTPKEDVNDWAEWSSADKMFGDDCLVIAIIHV